MGDVQAPYGGGHGTKNTFRQVTSQGSKFRMFDQYRGCQWNLILEPACAQAMVGQAQL